MNSVIIEQDKELFKEFIEFCDKQPKDKNIVHKDWESCAVGQFCAESSLSLYDNLFNILGEGGLGNTSSLYWKVGNGECPNTYGEFAEFLRKYL